MLIAEAIPSFDIVSDSDDIFWVTWIRCSISTLSSLALITSTLEAIIFAPLLARIEVRIPVSVAPGTEGSWWSFNSDSDLLFAFLIRKFRRSEYHRAFCSRDFSAFRPRSERTAVMETMITAIVASISCQNNAQCTSIFLGRIRSVEMRAIAITIIVVLRQRKMPRSIFWLRLIFTFHSRRIGIMMTVFWVWIWIRIVQV